MGGGLGSNPPLASMGSALPASFSHPQPGRPQHTGTYYDPELAAALAAYLPDSIPTAYQPKQQQQGGGAPLAGNSGRSWAVTTTHDPFAASTFGRSVSTGLEQPKRQSVEQSQQQFSAASMSAFSASSLMQLPNSGGSDGGMGPPSGTTRQGSAGSMAAWGQMQQLLALGGGGQSAVGSGPRNVDEATFNVTAPPSSKTPVPAASSRATAGTAASAATGAPPKAPVAPIPPFALQLDPAGWLALPPVRAAPFWPNDPNMPNPSQVSFMSSLNP